MYTPKAEDMDWLRVMISLLTDGGTLAFPDARLIFVVDKTKQQMRLMNPEILINDGSKETYDRTVSVGVEIGYTVVIG